MTYEKLVLTNQVAKCEMDSDFLAKAASHVEKACMQDYGASDMTTLPPETPLDGEWDCDQEIGSTFSEGNNQRHSEAGASDGAGTGDSPEGDVAAARAEALNDVLRPMDRYAVFSTEDVASQNTLVYTVLSSGRRLGDKGTKGLPHYLPSEFASLRGTLLLICQRLNKDSTECMRTSHAEYPRFSGAPVHSALLRRSYFLENCGLC